MSPPSRSGITEQLGQRQFQGLAKAEREAVLSFRVPGQIFTLPVKVGQNIEAGAVVATLDAEHLPGRGDGASRPTSTMPAPT